jgi:hypothetical protein
MKQQRQTHTAQVKKQVKKANSQLIIINIMTTIPFFGCSSHMKALNLTV